MVLIFLVLQLATGAGAQQGLLPSGVAVGGDLLNLDWRVYVAAKPVYCILVEKDRQLLRVLRHDGRVKVVAEYVAGTGENFGRKEVEGDAKTPEGVYLITKSYLDHKMSIFGTRAFHLNYPNYFDIQDGRTGNGIFIHGTNRPLRLSSSNGCVTLGNEDLDNLAGFLEINTPIFIVPSLAELGDAAEYPNLTEKDFAGAKALLLPPGESQADFASLYSISINDQIVVVGEYWPGQGSDVSLRKAIAYIQQTQDGRWFVADRGPTGEVLSTDTTIASTGRAAWDGRAIVAGADEIDVIAAGEKTGFWEPSLADIYLSWRQERIRSGRNLFASDIEQQPEPVTASANRDGLIYGLFIFATLISICSAAVMIRRQGLRLSRANTENTGEMSLEGDGVGVEQAAILRVEVKQAMDMLQSVRQQIDEEERSMRRQEVLEERIGVLEKGFQSREDTVAALAAGQAMLKEERDNERIGREETIDALRLDVAEVKRYLAEAYNGISTSDTHSGIVQQQLIEITQLLVEQGRSLQAGRQEATDARVVCDQLDSRICRIDEALERERFDADREDAKDEQAGETLAMLQAVTVELATIREEVASLRLVPDSKVLGDFLQGLHRDNQKREEGEAEIREVKSILESLRLDLGSEKTITATLEAEVAAREKEIRSVREAGERERRELESALLSLESSMQALKLREEESRHEKDELLAQQQMIAALQSDIAAREQEIALLRETERRQRKEAEDSRQGMEANLAEVVVARQVEITHLSTALRAAEERVLAERDLAAELNRGVAALKEDLHRSLERESVREQQVRKLNDENIRLKIQMKEIEKKSTVGAGGVVIKGAPSLPDDVLRKWMGKGQ